MESRKVMQVDSITTIVDLFRYTVARDRTDLIKFKRGGSWQTLSARQLDEQVRLTAMGLYELGVRAGDHVGLLAENCIEWTIADLGVLNCGAADVPIYATQAPKQVAYILNDAGVEVIFISNQKQYDRVSAELSSCPRLRAIVAFEPFSSSQSRVISFADLLQMGRQADRAEPRLYDTLRATVQPASVATLIYTSGTTGDPKGVMLTHGNLVSNAITNAGIAQMNEGETALSFLPFSHVFERMTIYMYLYAGSTIYYAQSMDTVAEDLLAARPHFMTSVPRLFEKIYARAMEKAEEGGRLKAAIARWAVVQAKEWAKLVSNGKEPGALLQLKHAIADRLVFTKWRAALGGRVRGLVSGGAPLSPELALAFYGAGIPIYQGYGMTESSPVIAANYPGANRIGSVGKPIPGIKLKIAEDGEILCSGPNVMPGYYNRVEETKDALETDREGRVWLHTGDIGRLDADGFLFITDRKKDLLKTSGGKYIAPQPIENAIKQSRFVNQVVVIGDQRKFPAALIVPQMEVLRAYAAQNGIAEDGQALLNNPQIVDLIEKEVERCTGDFSHYEKVKGIILIDREMTIENGELTPTLKVRRRVVVDHHRQSIDQLYAEKEAYYTTKK
ncbi:MAG: long-chain fatty acid--CoA ligase [Blastocatellia bacterium]|nr:long-chain fatty acid--CoA ligase [Blastocatellia bacterium]